MSDKSTGARELAWVKKPICRRTSMRFASNLLAPGEITAETFVISIWSINTAYEVAITCWKESFLAANPEMVKGSWKTKYSIKTILGRGVVVMFVVWGRGVVVMFVVLGRGVVVMFVVLGSAVQIPPLRPVKPTLQTQDVVKILFDGECEYFGHDKQFPLPVPVLYLPSTHCVHAPPSGPDEPTLQTQSVSLPLASGPLELDGHA